MLSRQDQNVSLLGVFQSTIPASIGAHASTFAISSKRKIMLFGHDLVQMNSHMEVEPSDQVISHQMHQNPIVSLKFTRRSFKLISCSSDAIVLWDLALKTPTLIAQDIGQVSHIAIDFCDSWIACCVKCDILVFNLATKEMICFEGHEQKVNQCEFLLPVQGNDDCKSWFISVSDDRTFKIWDISSLSCIYQSGIISSSPFTCVALDPAKFCCALGSEDGKIRIFNLRTLGTLKCEPRLLYTFDSSKVESFFQVLDETQKEEKIKVVSSLPIWKQTPKVYDVPEPLIELSKCILSIVYVGSMSKLEHLNNLFLVFYAGGFLVLNADNYNVLSTHSFGNTNVVVDDVDKQVCLQNASTLSFSSSDGLPNCLNIIYGNNFSGYNFMLRLHFSTGLSKNVVIPKLQDDQSLLKVIQHLVALNVRGERWIENTISDCLVKLEKARIYTLKDVDTLGVESLPELPNYIKDYFKEKMSSNNFSHLSIPQKTSPEKSILFKTIKKPSKTIKPSTSTSKTISPGKVGAKDFPVTFKSRVKSSGYLKSPPVGRMFGNYSPKSKPEPKSSPKDVTAYCSYEGLDTILKDNYLQHKSAITGLKYHPSGNMMASCSADKIARFYNSSGNSKDFCHNNTVNSISWSLLPAKTYGHLLLTSCRDGKARLWSTERTEPILDFPASSSKEGKQHEKDIKNALFFYKDRIVLVPCQDRLIIYDYSLEPNSNDSIRPQLNYNTNRLIKSINTSGQSISSIGCVNAILSNIAFVATSDKSISIIDMHTAQILRKIENAHVRSCHDISLSDYSTSSNNTFLTSAITDSVKLWDIRQDSCIMHLHGHVNRHAAIKTKLSPCGNFVAAGSEDQHAYIYDIRSKLVSYKTKGNHTDTVSCVDFHPKKSILITGGYDGKIRKFGPCKQQA